MQDRQLIFTHYNHLIKWIDSCVTTEQSHACDRAIDNFEKAFYSHAAVGLFLQDLRGQWADKQRFLHDFEIMTLKLINVAA